MNSDRRLFSLEGRSTWKIMLLLLSLTILFGLVGCGPQPAAETPAAEQPASEAPVGEQPAAEAPAAYKETVIIGVSNDITTLDPQASNTDANMMAFTLTHETLVQIDPATGAIVPGLAESWEASEDGLTLTFEIAKDATFTDGSPCTANDVKFTYDRAKDSSFANAKVSDISEITVLDDQHIQIVLKRPTQEFLILLAHRGMSILSEKLVTANPNEGPYVGTGMFSIKEWLPGDQISFNRYEAYRNGPAPTKTIVFKLYKEASTRLIALQAGEIDVCIDPSTLDLTHIQEDDKLELISIPNVVMLYLAINNEKPGLDNVHVRKAIAYAFDKASMVEAAFNGQALIHNNYINAGQFGLKPDLATYDYNIEKAKEELAASGFAAGELTFSVMVDKEYKKTTALILKESLAEIGIGLELEELETAALKGKLNDAALDYELCLYQWTDADGTDFTVRNMYGSSVKEGVLVKNGSNRANLKDETLNTMIDEALVELDVAKREQMYFAIEEYLHEIVPIVPICTSFINVGTQKGVSGAVWLPTAKHDYRLIVSPQP